MRRIIGKVLVTAAIAGTTAAWVAGPSSAMPRDECMDEVHYFQQLSWYETMEAGAFDVFAAWGAAAHEVNPVSGESWTANLPSGYQTVFTQADYTARFNTADVNYLRAQSATQAFEASAVLC